MFRPLGLYNQIPCPKQHNCNLQNCIFSHDSTARQDEASEILEYDPFSAGEPQQPPPKKRKIEHSDAEARLTNRMADDREVAIANIQSPSSRTIPNNERPVSKEPQKIRGPEVVITNKSAASKLPSMKRPVSPPPPKRDSKQGNEAQVEKLVPRPVPKAPAMLKVRMSLIDVLYKQMTLLNSDMTTKNGGDKSLILSDQQIIKWILDEEEQAATKLGSDIYRNAMSQKILQVKKIKPTDWQGFVNGHIKATKSDEQTVVDKSRSGLSTEEEIQVLKFLRTNLTGLDAHGYVTKPPSNLDIQKATDALRTSGGYEVCDRCGTRFQVFPGRDDQGRLTTKGECHYHWAKINRVQYQRTDHITGQGQASYPCCGQLTGSEGCTQAATHVFKVTDPKRMAALLQFEQTPSKSDGKKRRPVAFDCEMGYTTHGMEMVRITAVSWPENSTLLDVLVRPYGEILDLNTRFSGVTQEQFARALPYDTAQENQNTALEEGGIEAQPLRKVDSPAVARQLMFDLIAPETPLIGHAIDNDLNTCRIIHSFVVDTVLLYPHPRGLPARYGLKVLTTMYLHRSIQTGGDAGHDSKEDSIATGDLVKIKVTEKWQMMRLQGWKFEDGTLIPPTR